MTRWQRWTVVMILGLGLAASAAWAVPPPWAPAHGYRRKAARTVYYEPAPFIYSGVTYIPLRNVTSLIGAALLWNDLDGRATITFNGRELGLVVGSRSLYYDDETILLPAAPIVVRDVVYVPATFCEEYLQVPVRHRHGYVSLEGPRGWHDFRVASRPPARVYARPWRSAPARERVRIRTRERVPVWQAPRRDDRRRETPRNDRWTRPSGGRDRGQARAESPRGRGRDRQQDGEGHGRGQGHGNGGGHGRGEGQGNGGGHGRGRGHGGD